MDCFQIAPADQAAKILGSVGFCNQVPSGPAAGVPSASDTLHQQQNRRGKQPQVAGSAHQNHRLLLRCHCLPPRHYAWSRANSGAAQVQPEKNRGRSRRSATQRPTAAGQAPAGNLLPGVGLFRIRLGWVLQGTLAARADITSKCRNINYSLIFFLQIIKLIEIFRGTLVVLKLCGAATGQSCWSIWTWMLFQAWWT